MKKKEYERPTMQVVQLQQQPTLLAGSNPAPSSASFEAYEEDNTFSWDE